MELKSQINTKKITHRNPPIQSLPRAFRHLRLNDQSTARPPTISQTTQWSSRQMRTLFMTKRTISTTRQREISLNKILSILTARVSKERAPRRVTGKRRHREVRANRRKVGNEKRVWRWCTEWSSRIKL